MKYKNSFGLEMETLVFDKEYNPYYVPVSKLNSRITKDFADNQLEFVTTVEESTKMVAKQMCKSVNSLNLNVLAWPLSVPGKIDYEIETAKLESEVKMKYRKELLKKYPAKMQLLCGIHYNFSYDEKYLLKLFEKSEMDDYTKYKSEFYFSIFQKLYKYLPILLVYNSFTPFYNDDFEPSLLSNLKKVGKNMGLENSISLRNGLETGYCNESKVLLDCSSLENYRKSIAMHIEDKNILSEAEIYSKFRLKGNDSILDGEIKYIELRFMDKNPFKCCSFTVEQLDFIHIFMMWLTTVENENVCERKYLTCLENINSVALNGLDESLKVNIDNEEVLFKDWAYNTLDSVKNSVFTDEKYKKLIEKYQMYLKNYEKLPVFQMRKYILEENITVDDFGKRFIQNII